MERFEKTYRSKPLVWPEGKTWSLAGVVGSGNLEVLFEKHSSGRESFECTVETSFPGYRDAWLAGLEDFAHHYPVGGTKVTIHDQGAPPIVVMLRLRQAYESIAHAQT